jgi:hypothetical protein
MLCPNCGETVERSRARGLNERLTGWLTHYRVYRCGRCGWRGWLVGRYRVASHWVTLVRFVAFVTLLILVAIVALLLTSLLDAPKFP